MEDVARGPAEAPADAPSAPGAEPGERSARVGLSRFW
jgi:hypothetical protein